MAVRKIIDERLNYDGYLWLVCEDPDGYGVHVRAWTQSEAAQTGFDALKKAFDKRNEKQEAAERKEQE